MKKYEPEVLVMISRYQNYFPTLVPELQRNVYRRMKDLIEEEAYRIVSEEMWKFLDPSGMQKLAKLPFFLPLMKKIVPFGFKKGSGFGWRYTWHQDDPKDEFHFECNECIYAKILGKRNLMKLGAMCCHADVINYGALPYTDFIRTKTLCQGGDVCDFRFVRHTTDAGDGWERTKSI